MTRALRWLGCALLCATACEPLTTPRPGQGGGGGGTPPTLVFTVQPTEAVAGDIITPAVQVTARDTAGVRDSSFVASVTVELGTNPVAGILSGTLTVAAVAGVASFGDLTVDRAGSGYALRATATGAFAGTSAAFTVNTPP